MEPNSTAINNFLKQTKPILDKYEEVNRQSKEAYNLFQLLGIGSREVQTHSAFLSDLLSPDGTHQMGPVFLELFLSQLNITDFDASSTSVKKEYYVGPKTGKSGGRIDIILTDARRNHLIIENKIYAGEQENQLMRYAAYGKEYGRSAQLFYLTLNGEGPSEYATGKGFNQESLRCLSYQKDILNWLEHCQKEAMSHSVLQETIAQYVSLIKIITNQNQSAPMNDGIVKLVLDDQENLSAFFALQVPEAVIEGILLGFKGNLVELAKELGLELKFDISRSRTNTGFRFEGEKLAGLNLAIRFEFDKKYTQNFSFGFVYHDPKLPKKMIPKNLLQDFRKVFGEASSSEWWPAWAWWPDSTYNNWNFDTYQKVYKGEAIPLIKEKVQTMLGIIGA